jgi:hypothetical protein
MRLLVLTMPAANERAIPRYPALFNVKDFGAKIDGVTGEQRAEVSGGQEQLRLVQAGFGSSRQ